MDAQRLSPDINEFEIANIVAMMAMGDPPPWTHAHGRRAHEAQ